MGGYEVLHGVADVQLYEQQLVQSGQASWSGLVELAAAALLKYCLQSFPKTSAIVVVCGRGHNGADGLQLAIDLHNSQCDVRVCCLGGMDRAKPLTRQLYDKVAEMGIVFVQSNQLAKFDIVIDALLGIGCRRAPTAEYAVLIDEINAAAAHVLSVDCPSGLDADTGNVYTNAVKADVTLTMMFRKRGLYVADAYDHVGMICFDDLAGGERRSLSTASLRLLEPEAHRCLRIAQRMHVHKYDFGRAVVIAGRRNSRGAGVIAAESAARSGCGLVTLLDEDPVWSSWIEMNFTMTDFAQLRDDAVRGRVQSIVIGPGLGADQSAQKWLRWCSKATLPIVYDADALHWLAMQCDLNLSSNALLLPHEAEAAVLLGWRKVDVVANRFLAIQALVDRYQCAVLLKGPGSILAVDGDIFVFNGACPALAVAGSGDCLAGLIGGYLAQGFSMKNACIKGVSVHLMIGKTLEMVHNGRGVLATDMVAMITELANAR